jgi:hypothetical protein
VEWRPEPAWTRATRSAAPLSSSAARLIPPRPRHGDARRPEARKPAPAAHRRPWLAPAVTERLQQCKYEEIKGIVQPRKEEDAAPAREPSPCRGRRPRPGRGWTVFDSPSRGDGISFPVPARVILSRTMGSLRLEIDLACWSPVRWFGLRK